MELLAVFAPLPGFLLAFLFGRKIGDKGAQFVTCAGMIVAAFASIILFFDVIVAGQPRIIPLATWISSGDFEALWSLRVDQLTVVMMCVINIVSACVHIYSIGYMAHDSCKARFMAYLSLFTFAMLMLVSADNLLQLFFGWEGVGLASYLLIGFWNYKPSANVAAVKAFVVNRIGDFGLLLAIMAVFVLFGSVDFSVIFAAVPEMADKSFSFAGREFHALTLIGLLLFIGAVGKSAQLGLHTWLPDAMEGPTPVSALIHAATMVTAGVFLIARFSPLYEYAPTALMVVCVVGALTALVAATIALTQFDIKRVIAYSTMSQLGYMFFALGVSAYGAAIFHLFTHAFFKALLFLGAGSVIHSVSDEQDMRKMGGLWKLIPTTYALMWIGSLALAGMPFFAGYYSKDIMLEAAWSDHTWFGSFAFWAGIAAAFMTAFYSWRMILMTFHGKPRASKEIMSNVHESPNVMIMPLVVLAAGAILAGGLFYGGFVGSGAEHFWGESIKILHENNTVEAAHHAPFWVKKLPTAMGVAGILLAYLFYMWREGLATGFVRFFRPVHRLFFRKWYFDELYDWLFVRNALRIGRFFSDVCDHKIIDGLGPDGVASFSQKIAGVCRRFQTGYLYQYVFVMIIGLIALVSWFVFKSDMGL